MHILAVISFTKQKIEQSWLLSKSNLLVLEPYDGKLSRTVLRRERRSNPSAPAANKARIIMDKTFYSDKVDSLAYIDSGNGTIDRMGQVVLGIKSKKKILSPPVSQYFDVYKVDQEEKKVASYQCSQIDKHPQNFATNVLAATTIFILIVNLVEGIKIEKKVIGFNVDKLFIDKYNPSRN